SARPLLKTLAQRTRLRRDRQPRDGALRQLARQAALLHQRHYEPIKKCLVGRRSRHLKTTAGLADFGGASEVGAGSAPHVADPLGVTAHAAPVAAHRSSRRAPPRRCLGQPGGPEDQARPGRAPPKGVAKQRALAAGVVSEPRSLTGLTAPPPLIGEK